jgi:hypothetical protein
VDIVWEGHIAGVFEGYLGGRFYELSDGSRWRQDDRISEYVYRERPKARLLCNQSIRRMYLDVEGTSSMGSGRAG